MIQLPLGHKEGRFGHKSREECPLPKGGVLGPEKAGSIGYIVIIQAHSFPCHPENGRLLRLQDCREQRTTMLIPQSCLSASGLPK